MADSLVRGLLLVGILLLLIVTIILKKGRISMKFALVWYIPSLIIVLLALFPKIDIKFSSDKKAMDRNP